MLSQEFVIRTLGAALIYDIGVHRRNVKRHKRLLAAYNELVECHTLLAENIVGKQEELEAVLHQRNYLVKILNDNGIVLDEFDMIALNNQI